MIIIFSIYLSLHHILLKIALPTWFQHLLKPILMSSVLTTDYCQEVVWVGRVIIVSFLSFTKLSWRKWLNPFFMRHRNLPIPLSQCYWFWSSDDFDKESMHHYHGIETFLSMSDCDLIGWHTGWNVITHNGFETFPLMSYSAILHRLALRVGCN